MSSRLDVSGVPPQGGYIAKRCPVVIQNRILVPDLETEPTIEARFRMDAGMAFEAETLETIRGDEPGDWVVIPDYSKDEALQATEASLADRVEVIENGFLPLDEKGRRTGRPDLLVRSDVGYIPVDIKHHRTLDKEDESTVLISDVSDPFYEAAYSLAGWQLRKHQDDALQLAHYHRMLEAAGHDSKNAVGGILGKEGVIVWYDLNLPMWTTPAKSDGKLRKKRSSLERYDFEFGFRLDIAATALQQQDDAQVELIVEPMANSECGECGFHDYCWATLEAGSGDVSLLPRVSYQQWRQLRDLGIRDRSQVADLHYPTAALLKAGVEVDTFLELASEVDLDTSLESLRPRATTQLKHLNKAKIITAGDLLTSTDADTIAVGGFIAPRILDARAALGPEPVYRRPGATGTDVPRADIEIDLDMENVNEGVYLWGALHHDRTTDESPQYFPFVTWEPLDDQEELRVFLAMWEWLTDQRQQSEKRGHSIKVYVWHEPAENSHLRRISKEADSRLHGKVNDTIASDIWVDLKSVFQRSWIAGGSIGLKTIAPLAGFEWEVDDPGGGLSMVKYQTATEPSEDSASARDWLLDYNRGDVLATAAIRYWLGSIGAKWPAVKSD